MIGTWQAFAMHYWIREPLFKHIEGLLFSPAVVTNRDIRNFSLIATAIFAVSMLSVIAAYEAVNHNFSIPTEWVTNLVA
jgi:hypothetical protein